MVEAVICRNTTLFWTNKKYHENLQEKSECRNMKNNLISGTTGSEPWSRCLKGIGEINVDLTWFVCSVRLDVLASTLAFTDREFEIHLSTELEAFRTQAAKDSNRVLVFPPLNPRLRFLIHRTVELENDLTSFSIGKGDSRRVVLVHTKGRAVTHRSQTDSATQQLYGAQSTMEQRKKRPDKLLYVPRAMRHAQPSARQDRYPPAVASEGTDTGRLNLQQVKDADDLCGTLKQDGIMTRIVNDNKGSELGQMNKSPLESCTDEHCANWTPEGCVEDLPIRCTETGWNNAVDKDIDAGAEEGTSKSYEHAGDNQNILAAHSPCNAVVKEVEEKHCSGDARSYSELLVDLSEDSVTLCQTGDHSDVEQIELLDCFFSPIPEATSYSKCVLGNEDSADRNLISFDEVHEESEGKGSVSLQVNNNNAVEKEEGEKKDEDQSWEAMFDDEGECLEPELMEELMVGLSLDEVKLQHAHIDYLAFQPKEPAFTDFEFDHVIEMYDFSPDIKTEDIIQAFSSFRTKGFVVKWVDDSHALGVFSSATAAREGLALPQAMLQTRPISQASKQSQKKLQDCVEFLEPVKPRPQTSAVLARRLVAGALGVRPAVNREKHETEKQQLKQAREQRRLATQQKEAIWEGRPDAGV